MANFTRATYKPVHKNGCGPLSKILDTPALANIFLLFSLYKYNTCTSSFFCSHTQQFTCTHGIQKQNWQWHNNGGCGHSEVTKTNIAKTVVTHAENNKEEEQEQEVQEEEDQKQDED
jgi:hypothetical protein